MMFVRMTIIRASNTQESDTILPVHVNCGGVFQWETDHKAGRKKFKNVLICDKCYCFSRFVHTGAGTGVMLGFVDDFYDSNAKKLTGNGQ